MCKRLSRFLTTKINETINFLKRNNYNKLLSIVPTNIYSCLLNSIYENNTGLKLNISTPKRFSEKIQYIKIRNRKSKKTTTCTDKLLVRDFIAKKINDTKFSPKIYGIWNSFDEMMNIGNFESFPESFVLKVNHSCNMNFIVRKKEEFLEKSSIIKKLFDSYLKTNFAYQSFEMQYEKIKPQIYIEEFLTNGIDKRIRDYRFLCFNGTPTYIEYFRDKTCIIFDTNWNVQEFTESYKTKGSYIKKPKNFEFMIDAAKKISQDFDFVRVDFIETADAVYIMELTFTPSSGFSKFYPDEFDLKLGNLLKLSK